MAILTKTEKKELLRAAHSKSLRKDFKIMEKNKRRYFSLMNADDYIRFATLSNAFINHKRKKFRKIKGNKFLL